jgi:hypothetical protein
MSFASSSTTAPCSCCSPSPCPSLAAEPLLDTLPFSHGLLFSGSSNSVPLPQIVLTPRQSGATTAAQASKLRRASAFVPDSPRIGMLLGRCPSTRPGGGDSKNGTISLSSDGGDLGPQPQPDGASAVTRMGAELSARSVAANPAAQAAAARSKAAADAVAAAADAAAALAAVRALESRYGSAVAPDAQLLALEQEAAFRDRSRKLHDVSAAGTEGGHEAGSDGRWFVLGCSVCGQLLCV